MKAHRIVIGLAAVVLAAALLPAAAGPAAAELDCVIEPNMVVSLSAPIEGLVETVAVDRGDVVEKGQVVATLEASLERAALEAARFRAAMETPIKTSQARLELATRRAARSQQMHREGTLSAQENDEAQSEKILAEMALLEARETQALARLEAQRAAAALALRTIRSPIAGVVVRRFLNPGELAGGQTPLVRLAQLNPLRVEVFAPVSMLGAISVGMSAQVRPEAPVGGTYAARVAVADRVADASSGTFGVRLELPNPGNRLPAGLRCKVRFPR
ncbi:MAG TPA: efflux RND transporter periplasmic adaptor subunit [bacterium]|nr:efflux RND transporter periplasmic adaptor subunit [bacterium]